MSVRVNLLPEARLVKLRNQQTKRLVMVICFMIGGAVGVILVVLLLLLGARNIQFATNKSKIDELKVELAKKETIEKDIAWFNAGVNEQDRLLGNRILISQLFDRLSQATPQKVAITDIDVDSTYAVKASVKAETFNDVALFINALKTYNVDFNPIEGFSREPVFTDVNVETVTKKNAEANFEIKFKVAEKLVKKFRADAASTSQASPSPSPSGGTR